MKKGVGNMSNKTNDRRLLVTSFNKDDENIHLQGLTKIFEEEKWLIWSVSLNRKNAIHPINHRTNEIKLQRLLSLDTISNQEPAVHEIAPVSPDQFPGFLSKLERDVRESVFKEKLFYNVFDDETHILKEFEEEFKALSDGSIVEITVSTETNEEEIYSLALPDFIQWAYENYETIKPTITVVGQVLKENGNPIRYDVKSKQIKIYDMNLGEFTAVMFAGFKNK
jgi:hypothetical protein